ncbi:hypothetical protein ASD21_00430 [Caulobacter sp. Root1455]|uniref:toll/interleukin-1 receptor domain-containing protein n=1 Tax=unclassified Caulobacter TaxID=2648921 RepID=UPI0006FC8A31|nr:MULTISPECIES: toll/interleukin-1 receptor domain-containing protein [unclassified Caulobacter]KQY35880.1 hypothetical protein ASD38_04875 [Caulobacter sp. Root487D2Y]KQZ06144.1 hypothetical protein ASD21_00430 [Caulobacter sp. Root1455]
MDGDRVGAARYRAFISYSHRDAVFGRQLHGRLERYALPGRLVGRETPRGNVPRRLAPIFRDREELAAASNLTVEVRAALADSNALIVVCTPNAAASPWVAREVELFRELHPDRPILAALVAGEPHEAFPAPLRDGVEPLAADFRSTADGPRLALLKLVAGVTGVGLDELVQRDAQRRLRSVTAVTGASLAAVLGMGLLTAFALNARDEAERQRGEAESLVEFMMTDLRGKLTGSERLAVQGAVSQRALDYYAGQDPARLSPASRARLGRLLHAVGEDGEQGGDLSTAATRFHDAYALSTRLLAAEPDNPQRILDQAQNEYGLATIDYRRKRWPEAKAGYERYRDLAGRLTRFRPDNIEYRRELGYAEGNLCAVAVESGDKAGGLAHCAEALKVMQEVDARMVDARRSQAANLVTRHGWMADAYNEAGDLERAAAERRAQEKILDAEMAAHPDDRGLQADWIGLKHAQGGLAYVSGDGAGALSYLAAGRARAVELIAFDPDNARARRLLARIDESIAYVKKNPAPRRRR